MAINPSTSPFGNFQGTNVTSPFGPTGAAFGVSSPFTSNNNVDRFPGNTIFGVTNNSGTGFNSTPPSSFHSNSNTSSIFGVPKVQQPFAPVNSSSGFSSVTTGFPNTSNFDGSNTSSIFGVPKIQPPFAPVNSSSGFASVTNGFPNSSIFDGTRTCAFEAPKTPGFGPFSTKPTPSFSFNSTSPSETNSIFGIRPSAGFEGKTTTESTVGKGSRVASYTATRNPSPEVNEKFQSISAMPIYQDKSHEELRSEDYELSDKGGHKPWGGFKTSDSPSNTFKFDQSFSNQSSSNSPFGPFKSNPFAPKSQDLFTPTSTISTTQTLFPNPAKPNPFESQRAFNPQPSTPTLFNTNFNLFAPKSQDLFTPNKTVSMATTLFPSQNPINTNPFESQKALNPQPTIPSSTPTFFNTNFNPFAPKSQDLSTPSATISTTTTLFPSPNPGNLNPFESQKAFNPQPNTFNAPSFSTFSSSTLSSTVSPPTQPASISPWPSTPHFANNPSQPSPAWSGLTKVAEVGCQNIAGQQYVPASTVDMQPSVAVNPFPTRSSFDRPNTVTSIQFGISSLPVSNNTSSKRITPLLRIRHVSSRNNRLPAQRHSYVNSEPKVPFFRDEDRPFPVDPVLPRENPRSWVINSMPVRSGKGSEDRDHHLSSSFQINLNTTVIIGDDPNQDDAAEVNVKQEADILALMPKLPEGEYYTEPSLKELSVKEKAEPGSCSRVDDFVVGRQGYGSITFLGKTDVRFLDIEPVIQFKNREVIVYADDKKKPPLGQSLNKPAEVTLLNVKCVSKKTGKQYVDGPEVRSYEEMLIKKASEQGAEFVSYDPVRGEWKFRVQHF